MIRKVITPEQQNISINIPADYIGKQVEVIAFTIDDNEDISLLKEPMIHYASEKVLAKDWLTEEEDKAWQNL
jgi:hypothetical protein